MSQQPKRTMEVYCDESGHELLTTKEANLKAPYFGIGALRFEGKHRDRFKEEIKALKQKHNIPWEIKWRKLSGSNLAFYKELADWFCKSPTCFRLVRIDAQNFDADFWHNRDPELGFYKFYYQCLKNIVREDFKYRIFTDFKTNQDRNRLKHLDFYLNFYSSGYVESVQSLGSKDSLFIQLADLFTGAVTSSHNEQIKSPAKLEFCRYLATKLGKNDLKYCSRLYDDPKFNIFCLEFGKTA